MRLSSFLAVLLLGLAVSPDAHGAVVMNVFVSPAPNVFGSPSWDGYVANALNSLENNLGNVGDRGLDPTAYEIIPDGSFIGAGRIHRLVVLFLARSRRSRVTLQR